MGDGVGLITGNFLQNVPMLNSAVPSKLEIIDDGESLAGQRHINPVVHHSIALPTKKCEIPRRVSLCEAFRKDLDGEVTTLLRERVVLLVFTVEMTSVSPSLELCIAFTKAYIPRNISVERTQDIPLDDKKVCEAHESLILQFCEVASGLRVADGLWYHVATGIASQRWDMQHQESDKWRE